MFMDFFASWCDYGIIEMIYYAIPKLNASLIQLIFKTRVQPNPRFNVKKPLRIRRRTISSLTYLPSR